MRKRDCGASQRIGPLYLPFLPISFAFSSNGSVPFSEIFYYVSNFFPAPFAYLYSGDRRDDHHL